MKMKIGLCSLLLTTNYLFGTDLSSQSVDITKDSNLTPTNSKLLLPIKKENNKTKDVKEIKIHKNELVLKLKTIETQQIQQNKCDIQKLKLAVAKLIVEVNDLKNQNKQLLEEKNFLLNKKQIPNDLIKLPKKHSNKDIILNVLEKKNQLQQPRCRLIKEKLPINVNVSVKGIKRSYKKYDKPKRFLIVKTLHQYKYPVASAKIILAPIKAGKYIEADMFTKYGWVHVKNGGWIVGFLLKPKISFEPSTEESNTTNQYIYKKVCN